MLVQETDSEIGSSQICHKGSKLTIFLSLICPVSPLPIILEIHFCLGIFWALGAVSRYHIEVGSIWRSGLHFLSNCHSNGVVTGRAWLLPLIHLLPELSNKAFLMCAWN